MDKHEQYTIWEFNDRRWQIGKLDSWTGSYVAYKLMSEVMPMGINQKANIPTPPDAKTMSKKDFIEFERDCLSSVSELLQAGPVSILDVNNNFAVIDMEFNSKLLLALTIQSLMWNVTDFFDEGLLKSIFQGLSSLTQSTAPTSTITSLRP